MRSSLPHRHPFGHHNWRKTHLCCNHLRAEKLVSKGACMLRREPQAADHLEIDHGVSDRLHARFTH